MANYLIEHFNGWRVTVGKALTLGLLALVTLVCVNILFDVHQLSALAARVKAMVQEDIAEVRIIGSTRELISELENVVLELLAHGGKPATLDQRTLIQQRISRALDAYRDLQPDGWDDDETRIWEQLGVIHGGLQALTDNIVALIKQDKLVQAEALFLGPWESIHHEAFLKLTDLLNYEIQKLAKTASDTEASLRSMQTANITLSVMVIALSLLLAAAVVFSFTRPVAVILETIEGMLRGDALTATDIEKLGKSGSPARQFQRLLDWLHGSFEDSCHELRTALTVIRGEAEVALRGSAAAADDYRAPLVNIANVAEQTGRLVDDLIFLGRSQVGQIDYQMAVIALPELLGKVVNQARNLAALRGVSLRADIERPALILGDAQRLNQAFIILLDNAIKYTESRGEVGIAVAVKSDQVWVTITDTGIGIAEQDLPHIFRRFYRAANTRSRSRGGTGLGLAIARSVIKSHRGDIALTSSPGRGTVVRVALPRTKNLGVSEQCAFSSSKTTAA